MKDEEGRTNRRAANKSLHVTFLPNRVVGAGNNVKGEDVSVARNGEDESEWIIQQDGVCE